MNEPQINPLSAIDRQWQNGRSWTAGIAKIYLFRGAESNGYTSFVAVWLLLLLLFRFKRDGRV